MEPTAAQTLSRLGGSSDGFVARQINPVIASSADLVLTMTEEHRDTVLKLSPRHLKRTFTLLEAAHIARSIGQGTVSELSAARGSVGRPENADVPDPIGRSAIVFGDVGNRIESALLDLLPRLNG